MPSHLSRSSIHTIQTIHKKHLLTELNQAGASRPPMNTAAGSCTRTPKPQLRCRCRLAHRYECNMAQAETKEKKRKKDTAQTFSIRLTHSESPGPPPLKPPQALSWILSDVTQQNPLPVRDILHPRPTIPRPERERGGWAGAGGFPPTVTHIIEPRSGIETPQTQRERVKRSPATPGPGPLRGGDSTAVAVTL